MRSHDTSLMTLPALSDALGILWCRSLTCGEVTTMSDMDGPVMVAMSACIGCGRVFTYNPELVPSLLYVPSVRNSLELALAELAAIHTDRHDRTVLADQADCDTCQETIRLLTDEAVREPICPSCAATANPHRAANGFEPIPTEDTAALGGWR